MNPVARFGASRIATFAILALVACSVPDITFVPDAAVHCNNHRLDADAGESDTDCGGADCPACALGRSCRASRDCAGAECLLGFCQEPGCDNSAMDGDETAIDCGGSCEPCRDGQHCLDPADCQSKVCGEDELCASATCADGVQNSDELGVDCGGSFCNDGCGIGTPCELATECESGRCDAATGLCALNCQRGKAECDGDLSEACETNVLTSVENCGACGQTCDLPNATPSCTGGICQIEACVEPWVHCSADGSGGCEVDTSSDVMNCGGCGRVCPDFHGEPSCVEGKCAIECAGGFGDCDHDARTGCETSLNDVNDCGRCGVTCDDAAGVPNCVDGNCGHTVCDAGLGDCDGDDTCETDLATDDENCGRCGNHCSAVNGEAACRSGQCVITSCHDGWGDCDTGGDGGGYATGCESNLTADAQHCGQCDVDCSSVSHGTGTCQAGSCALDCANGFADCNGKVSDGCETDTTSDPAHCGGCKNPCKLAQAEAACVNSSCVVAACEADYEDCNAADGCETNVSSSVQHCGSCAGTCSSAGATQVSCHNGSCDAPTCDANHLSCDGNNDNGCETDISTNTNCGACGKSCSQATPTCVRSGGTYACQATVTVANTAPYPTASAQAGSLTFNLTPRAGSNRLELLAIVSDALTSGAVSAGIAGSRPGTVKFGTRNMIAGPSQAGTSDAYSPDLFIYYLPLGDAASDEAQVQVNITGASGPANVVVAQALQLNGARQSTPITTSVGGFVGTPDPADPGVVSSSLTLSVSGSLIYSFVSDYWDTTSCAVGTSSTNCPTWSVTPATNLTSIETMATPPLTFYPPNSGTAPMRAFGMVVTAVSPSLPAAGTYAPTWSDPHPGRLTHLAVAIAPAQSP